ncbi:MAG TPA: hypothetical protein VGE74_04390, partial [Gemmata sp.]
AGLCVVGAALVALLMWGPDGKPPSGPPHPSGPQPEVVEKAPPSVPEAGPVEPPPRVFRPGEWCELLDRPPTVLLWPANGDNSWKGYDPAKKGLNVMCDERGMLRLADVAAPGFDLEVTLTQTPWTGGAGVFFRGRNDPPVGDRCVAADVLLIERIDANAQPNVAHVSRGEMRRLAAPPHRFSPTFLGRGSFPRPGGGPHRLTLRVEAAGLTRAWWDDQIIDPRVCQLTPLDTPRTGAFGSVGIFVQHGTALYRSFRILVHPASGAP